MNRPNSNYVAKVESIDGLTDDEATMLKSIAANRFDSLEEAFSEINGWVGQSWFVYRGGSHVALHRRSGANRLLLVRAA